MTPHLEWSSNEGHIKVIDVICRSISHSAFAIHFQIVWFSFSRHLISLIFLTNGTFLRIRVCPSVWSEPTETRVKREAVEKSVQNTDPMWYQRWTNINSPSIIIYWCTNAQRNQITYLSRWHAVILVANYGQQWSEVHKNKRYRMLR